MLDALHPENWRPFYTAVAGAASALVGLLFVALSLNLSKVLKVRAYRERARQAMGGFISLMVLSIIVLIPGQSLHILGAELVIASLIAAGIVLRLQVQILRSLDANRRLGWFLHNAVLHVGWLLGIAAGVTVFLGQFGGLYWLIPTVLLYFLWNINNAWALLVQVAEDG